MNITYKRSRNVSARSIHSLFQRNRWKPYCSGADVAWYLKRSACVITAWHGRRVVGIAVLVGDGRCYLELETLLVDADYRGQRIGTALMDRIMAQIDKARPHGVKIEVFSKRAQKFYARYGFVENKGTWLLDRPR